MFCIEKQFYVETTTTIVVPRGNHESLRKASHGGIEKEFYLESRVFLNMYWWIKFERKGSHNKEFRYVKGEVKSNETTNFMLQFFGESCILEPKIWINGFFRLRFILFHKRHREKTKVRVQTKFWKCVGSRRNSRKKCLWHGTSRMYDTASGRGVWHMKHCVKGACWLLNPLSNLDFSNLSRAYLKNLKRK